MDTLFEQHVVQNTALTSFAIAETVKRYQQVPGKEGLNLFACLLIPPLVYHRRTAENLANRQMTDGLFFRAIADDHEMALGVQSRLMATADHSFDAIHLGCSSRLIRMTTSPSIRIFRGPNPVPTAVRGVGAIDSVKLVLAAAKRLGFCFATTDFPVIVAALRLRF